MIINVADDKLLKEIQDVQQQSECLLTQEQVFQGIVQLAKPMSAELADKNPILICIMNGGLNFTAALLNHFHFPLQVDYLHLTRYQGALSGSAIQWISKPVLNLENRVVLLIDDILDQGLSLQAAQEYCIGQSAKQIYSAVLIKKRLKTGEQKVTADFFAFECEDRYLFGFGMDYKNYLRNAPGIYALKKIQVENA